MIAENFTEACLAAGISLAVLIGVFYLIDWRKKEKFKKYEPLHFCAKNGNCSPDQGKCNECEFFTVINDV